MSPALAGTSDPSRTSPLPDALLAAELGPAVMADDPCEAAFGSADPTEPRKYYRARYYDPKAGRFISEDPIGLDGGDINFYAYVENNSVNWIDPWGLQKKAPVIECPGGIPGLPPNQGTLCCENGKLVICIPEGMKSPDRECLIQHEQTHYEEAKSYSCTGDYCKRARAPKGTFSSDECNACRVQCGCLKEFGESCDYVETYAKSKGCDTSPPWPEPPSPKPPRPRPRKPRKP